MEQEMKAKKDMDEAERTKLEEEYKQPWTELEEKGIDEQAIEQDFFVDKAPEPVFIPNPAGKDEETQIEDLELFDFELEAEPILEVLVGKSLETARMEAIEDYEKTESRFHKELYEREREAELIETQRMESAYNRGVEEIERAKRQKEAMAVMKIQTQKQLLARLYSRGVLGNINENAMKFVVEAGPLRAPHEYDLYGKYVPHLFGCIEDHIRERRKEKDILRGIRFFSRNLI